MGAVTRAELFEAIEASMFGADDDPAPDFIADADTVEELWEVRRHVETIVQHARRLQGLADAELAVRLDGDSVRLDDCLVAERAARTYRVMDPEAFWDWLGPDARLVFNPDYVRITGLRAVAEKRGRDPKVIVDSLLAVEEGAVKLQVTPIDRAPKWAQRMDHGQRSTPPRRRAK